MKSWKSLTTLFVCALVSGSSLGQSERQIQKCAELISGGLTLSEVFILLARRKLIEDKTLPRSGAAVYRLFRVAEELPDKGKPQERFAAVLEEYKLALEDWKEIEEIEFRNGRLGSPDFLQDLSRARLKKKKLEDRHLAVLGKLNAAAESAREKLKTLLVSEEEMSFFQSSSLLSEEQLLASLRRHSRDPKLTLSYLGVESVEEWRFRVLTERKALARDAEKLLMAAVLQIVAMNNEIPESDQHFLKGLAEKTGLAEEALAPFFGPKALFRDVSHLADATKERHAGAFVKVIDRRLFTEERRQKMREAVRDANEVVLFKLAENQDVKDFEAVKMLAQNLGNAPILVAPAFAEIGLIPEKLGWLFDEPNVHLMVDRGLQVTPDLFIVDHGFEDKRQNPFVGLAEIYEPTDRVVLFHPKVRAVTRPTGMYTFRPGWMVTTGSMSDPAYWGKFAISMSTDERAQAEAEMNRSVLVLSRRYRSEKLGSLIGSANGMAPRRVRYTEALYGNPAGLFDLGKIYTSEGVVDVPFLPAIELGDIHLGVTDPLFLKATREALEYLKIIQKNPNFGKFAEGEYVAGPVRLGALVLEDLVNGDPNNGHLFEQLLTLALADSQGALDLQAHFQKAAAAVTQIRQLLPNTLLIVPLDNHGHEWLQKRLQESKLLKTGRPKEVPLILNLMLDAIEDHANPYERIFQYFGIDTDKVRFMGPQDTFRIGIDIENPTEFKSIQGVEVGQHGQIGNSGSKSISLSKLRAAFGSVARGHTHSSAEHGQGLTVGTGTPIPQDYQRGPSGSDASLALIYGPTAGQLLRLERGSFVPNADPQDPKDFFVSQEYPRVLIRKMPPGGPTTDQYRGNPPANRYPR